MSALFEFLVMVFAALIPWDPTNHRARDRRLFDANKVACAIRALDGRVLNIGTEWSVGVCEIADGRLTFVPELGIVGDRTIPVLSATAVAGEPEFGVPAAWADSAHFVISTRDGDLFWAFPKHLSSEVLALLFPERQRA
ncbi:hypothetical protein I6E68_02940 [Salinibacterium sp. NSLL150]|uniref:hypothetical protein n=1 Tax=unclassified Salinibacterium TaxID=2632331 RepID=UPI0018CF9DEB|nr:MULTISPECIES: hypothetical protein [unclassified Salinibacterium]MBH0098094.1 hypothetical protein [Salinibacterium sp. NSLL35]MBH0100849.1 hypothetical protein [Salinibacterium sp. NSLL150]MBH0103608.1 hypothetical protein [Salinibacterium sp. NSLL16]MBH0106369.1 hypothetical protein [Salinibacterium sp. NSLL17]MBH0109866.1 hypothetical protein [Salinibacterium sp. NG22]